MISTPRLSLAPFFSFTTNSEVPLLPQVGGTPKSAFLALVWLNSCRMKSKKVYHDQLTLKPRERVTRIIRVNVLKKQRAKQNLGKTKFQRMILQDEKGNRMQAVLFGVDIDIYSNIIRKGKNYDIINPVVKEIDEYKDDDNDLQIQFCNSTTVTCLDNDASSSEPGYFSITEIPRNASIDDRFDLVGILIQIETPRVMTTKRSTIATVCEMAFTDNSSEKPIIVSAWQDLATNQCKEAAKLARNYPIIGLTELQISPYKGFSLKTTSSTEMDFDPKGEKADTLKKWCATNLAAIENRKLNLAKTCSVSLPTESMKIKDALAKKGDNTKPDEQLKLTVHIPDLKINDIKVALGCSNCGKNCEIEMGKMFMCENCNIMSASESKIYFNFKGTDGSGTIQLAAYTKNAEKILKAKATDIYPMSYEERETFIENAKNMLRTSATHLIIAPVPSLLLKHNVIKWILKDVVEN